MTQTHTCPADGCDYTGLKNSVCAHYSGKRDEPHSGGYEVAKNKLEGANGESSTDSQQQPTDTASSSSSSSKGNPTFGDTDPDTYASRPSEDDSGSSTDHELPCGHESVSDELVERAAKQGAPVECETCGNRYPVEP